MNANHFKQELLALESALQEKSKNSPLSPQNARHLYFELQRLVHQYASIQVRADTSKIT